MKSKLLGLIAFAMLGVSQAHANIIYTLNDSYTLYGTGYSGPEPIYSVSGTITTDGNLGVLSSADILDWSFTITGGATPYTLTNSNSQLALSGDALTATSAALLWAYGDPSNGDLGFVGIFGSFPFGGYTKVGFDYSSGLYFSEGVFIGGLTALEGTCPAGYGCGFDPLIPDERSGTQIVAAALSPLLAAEPTAPLPAALPLFATGLGVMGLFGWRTKLRNAAAPIKHLIGLGEIVARWRSGLQA